MSWQLAFGMLVWIALLQLGITARIAARLGGFRNVLTTPVRIWRPGHGIAAIGRRMRTVRWGASIGLPGEGCDRARTPAETVIVVADVRSIAAHRMVRVLAAMSSVRQSPVPWRWYLAGNAEQVKRLVEEMPALVGCHHRISQRAARRASASGFPLAIYVDPSGVVRQMGFLPDRPALAAFVNGCANTALRMWARAADEQGTASEHHRAAGVELVMPGS